MTTERRIAVEFAAGEAEARYALATLLGLLGAQWDEVRASPMCDLRYGGLRTGAKCYIPAGPQYDWNTPRPCVEVLDGLAVLAVPGGAPIPRRRDSASTGFDLVYATYACLVANWEDVDPCDDVGCPIAGASFLAKHDLLDVPLVHRYAEVLREALTEAGLPYARRRERATIVLTHDVDTQFGHIFGVRESMERLRRDVVRCRMSSGRRAAGLIRRTVFGARRSDPNDCFDKWAEWTESWRTRPTYFVASYGLFQRGSHDNDVPYDIRHPAVRHALSHALARGAEIGLHVSLQAREGMEQVARERAALEEALGVQVLSARHHWWALGKPPESMLEWQAAAGILVDCSFGYNDRPGFRRGIAVPFRPFSRELRRPLSMLSLPTHVMDVSIFDGRDHSAAVKELRRWLGIVMAVDGFLVLDWHAHAPNPRALNGAGPALADFLSTVVPEVACLQTPVEVATQVFATGLLHD